MSSYCDDMNDTAVASNSLWLRLRSIAEGTARASDKLLTAVLVVSSGTAMASDAVSDRVRPLIAEQVRASDEILDAASAAVLVVDSARASSVLMERTRSVLVDTAKAGDWLSVSARQLVVDRINASNEVLGQRRNGNTVVESVRASGGPVFLARTVVAETLAASDWAGGAVRTRQVLSDGAAAGELVLDGRSVHMAPVVDAARVRSEAFGALLARDVVQDAAVANDEPLQFGDFGQAWTSCIGAWAMSRYAPFTFTSLAVVDGVPMATDPGGVYALDGDSETIAGEIRTARVDLSDGKLVNLTDSLVESAMDGAAKLHVQQSGGGMPSYAYDLERRATPELTCGRFQLGRGLGGCHFSFTLAITGTHAYINDWRIVFAPSKRSL